MREPYGTADNAVITDIYVSAQYGRSCIDDHVVSDVWMSLHSDEELHAYSEIWYQIMQEANITTMLEFTKEPGKTLTSLIDAIRETDDKTKEMAKELARLKSIQKRNGTSFISP